MKRTTLYIVGILVLTFLGFGLWLYSPIGKSTIKNYALQRIAIATGYQVSADNFATNYYSHIKLEGITIADSTTASAASISRMAIDYRLFPTILGKVIVDSLISRDINLTFQQELLDRLLDKTKPAKTNRKKSRWSLQVGYVDVENASITYQDKSKDLLASIDDLNISYVPNDTIDVNSGPIHLEYQGKRVQDFNLRSKAGRLESSWRIAQLELKSPQTTILGEGTLTPGKEWSTAFTFEGSVGQDLLYIANSYLPNEYKNRVTVGNLLFSGAGELKPGEYRYSASIQTNSVQYDTITIRQPLIKFNGDNNRLRIERFRAILGTDLDTLSLSGEYDWMKKYAELQLSGHFTSLNYVKHFIDSDAPVDSPLEVFLMAEIPFEDLENSTGHGTITFSDPVVLGRAYSPIETDIQITKDRIASQTKYRTNTIDINGALAWPFTFSGEMTLNDFTEFDSTMSKIIRPTINSKYSGVIGEKEAPFRIDGHISAILGGETSPDVTVFPVTAELPIRASDTKISITNGSLQVNGLLPSTVQSDIRFSPNLSGSVTIREPGNTNRSGVSGMLRAEISKLDSMYRGGISISNLALSRWAKILPRTQEQVAGTFDLNSQFTVDGTSISGIGHMGIINARFAQSEIDSALFDFKWDGRGVSLTSGQGYSRQLSADVTGFLPFAPGDSLHVEVRGERWPLDIANPFLPEQFEVGGIVNPSILLNGSYLNPIINGKVEVDSGYFSWDKEQIPIQNFQSRITFSDSTYDVEFVQFRYQNYPVKITGGGNLTPTFTGELSVDPAGKIQIAYDRASTHFARAEFSNFPIQIISHYFPLKLSQYGYLNGQIMVSDIVDSLRFTTNGTWVAEKPGETSEWTYQWAAHYANLTLEIEESTLQTSNGTFTLHGAVPFDLTGGGISKQVRGDSLNLMAQVDQLKTVAINAFTDKFHGNSGVFNSELQIGGTWNLPDISGFIRGSDIDFQSPVQLWHVKDGTIDVMFQNRDFTIRNIAAIINDYPVTVDGTLHYEQNYNIETHLTGNFNRTSPFELSLMNNTSEDALAGTVSFNEVNLADITALLGIKQNIRGQLNFGLQLQGSRSHPVAEFSGGVDNLTLDDITFSNARFHGDYRDNWVTVDTVALIRQSANIRGEGRIAADFDLQAFNIARLGEHVEFNLTANDFPLESFEVLSVPNSNLSGIFNADFRYKQSPSTKSLNGYARIEKLTADLPYFAQKIERGSARFDFTGHTINMTEGELFVDRRPVRFTGQIKLPPKAPPAYDVSINTERIKLSKPGEIAMTLAPSDLHLITRADNPMYLEGNIRFTAFNYSKKIANPQLLSLIGTRTIRPQEVTHAMLEDIRLNLSIQMLKNATVENNLADLDFTADIQLNGPIFNPRYSGRVTSNDGEIYYLNRTFTIQNADIFFTGTPEMNPELNITAVTTVPAYQNIDEVDYNITLNISNTLRQPRVNLGSDPALRPHTSEPLTQSDIIGILAVGRPREQFSGVAGEGNFSQVLMRQAERFSSEKIASAMEYRVGRLLDLDRVTIEGNLFNMSGSQTPTFTAQKQLSSRLSLTYSSAIGHSNDQGVRLNYQLSPNWYLVTETSQREDYGVDIKYRIRFK